MTNIANLANQLNMLAIDSGLGRQFYAVLLRDCDPNTLAALAEAIQGETQMHDAVKGSVRLLALEKHTHAAKRVA